MEISLLETGVQLQPVLEYPTDIWIVHELVLLLFRIHIGCGHSTSLWWFSLHVA